MNEMKWIPVKERLPENYEWVIVTEEHAGDLYTKVAQFSNGKFDDIVWDDELNVIAWMPLPEPYKKED